MINSTTTNVQNKKVDSVQPPAEVALKPIDAPATDTLILAGDPEQQMHYAVKAAQMLVQILAHKPHKVMINGQQYLEFEDWQTLGRFYGATAGIEWTKPIYKETKVWGYEAKAVVMIKGELVSSAEAMCLRDEKNWATKDEFTLRSMAQTRASAKALRNVLAWVAVLGGFKPTPLEEMPEEMPRQYVPQAAPVKVAAEVPVKAGTANLAPPITERIGTDSGKVCEECSAALSVAVANFSQRAYNRNLCFTHQKELVPMKD